MRAFVVSGDGFLAEEHRPEAIVGLLERDPLVSKRAAEMGELTIEAEGSLRADEAHGKEALANGMKSIAARLARAVNRVCKRNGPVLDGRYHHRSLRTPREVHHALAYVLLNARRHLTKAGRTTRAAASRLDPASSGGWFDGWRPEFDNRFPEARGDPEVARARTWLLRVGWRRHGLIDPGEAPGGGVSTSG